MFGATPGSNPFGAAPATPSSSAFGFGTSGGSLFGSSTPATGGGLFGNAASTPASGGGLFGASTPATGGSLFGASTGGSSLFGTSTPAFGTTGAASTPSLFGAQTPATTSGGLFSTGGVFGQSTSTPSLFGQPAISGSAPLFGQTQQTPSPFGQAQAGGGIFGGAGFGQTQAQPQQSIFGGQLTTQMAPMAPPQVPLTAEQVKEIVDAYNDAPSNPNYRFRHLFLSVIDPVYRQKPAAVSDVIWAEAINRLQSLSEEDRQRLWPELASGFKDLSTRLRLQDEAIANDGERLKGTEANVRQLQRHFEADTVPWIQKLRQKEQELQRRLLHVMRLVEALEGRAHPNRPLSRGESALLDKLRSLVRQIRGPSAELPRRVESLLLNSRLDGSAAAGSVVSHGRIDEKSLAKVQALLAQQTEATKKLAGVLKKDARDAEIIVEESKKGLTAGNGGRGAGMSDGLVFDERLRRTPF